ncbi:MAG TPA: hypothetical protein VFU97_03730 [Xanthobacteraceae bacterium]|nr:hypothetical protein [Xanthobacteraceae bacterium]
MTETVRRLTHNIFRIFRDISSATPSRSARVLDRAVRAILRPSFADSPAGASIRSATTKRGEGSSVTVRRHCRKPHHANRIIMSSRARRHSAASRRAHAQTLFDHAATGVLMRCA